jgi:hypothetical protein
LNSKETCFNESCLHFLLIPQQTLKMIWAHLWRHHTISIMLKQGTAPFHFLSVLTAGGVVSLAMPDKTVVATAPLDDGIQYVRACAYIELGGMTNIPCFAMRCGRRGVLRLK